MGRTGILTPVAIFKDKDIDGTICNHASLHNFSIMKEILGTPYLGQKIWVYMANMIIPQISKEKHLRGKPKFDSTECILCPVCGEPITIEESESGVLNAMCRNPLCAEKLEKRIDHYLGKKDLDVKGISKVTIRKLKYWDWINGLKDIYRFDGYKNE